MCAEAQRPPHPLGHGAHPLPVVTLVPLSHTHATRSTSPPGGYVASSSPSPLVTRGTPSVDTRQVLIGMHKKTWETKQKAGGNQKRR